MSQPLRLILFDVDGTLVDSQHSILAAMAAAFDGAGLPVPPRAQILSIVGLSLDHAMTRLAPDLEPPAQAGLVAGYKAAFRAQRLRDGSIVGAPLYRGARETLHRLAALPDVLLGVATGKSQRGLDALLEAHDLSGLFVTRQVADHHPSKPHPSMILTALSETGVAACDAVMIGDTSFDMQMARAAGIAGLGVTWGYHPAAALRQDAAWMIDRFDDIHTTLETIWKATV